MRREKHFEFRRTIFKHRELRKAYVYATSPIQKIVGSFIIGDIIEDNPRRLWMRCGEHGGIKKDDFFDYFDECRNGYAIEIRKVTPFLEPIDPWDIIPNFTPPQSFCYLDMEAR